jgi:hypothetical protein
MDELESEAEFHGRCAVPATIASGLGDCAIEPTPERCRTCFLLAYGTMRDHCEPSVDARSLVDRTLRHHLDQLTELCSAQADTERPPPVILRPFWRLGRPPGWPIEDPWVVANALTAVAGKLGLKSFGKMFK